MASETTISEKARSTNTLGLLVQRRILGVICKNIQHKEWIRQMEEGANLYPKTSVVVEFTKAANQFPY